MGILPIDYVQLQRSVSCSREQMFKVGEGDKSLQLQRFLQFVLALGMISEIHLLERVLRVGVALVTSELR